MSTNPDIQSPAPVLLPPITERGLIGWLHANLFSNKFNTALTISVGIILGSATWFGLKWLLLESDWTVIPTLGGRFIIGTYNTEAACPGQDCFWRPQAALMLVTMLFGMAWVVAGGGLTKRFAIGIVVVLAAFSLLPYSLDTMGMDVRLLLLANIPALAVGWALARYTPLGATRWLAILAVLSFAITLVLLRGLPGVPGLQPVSVIHWGGLMLNLLLAVAGIVISFPIGIALALGRRSNLSLPTGILLSWLIGNIRRWLPLRIVIALLLLIGIVMSALALKDILLFALFPFTGAAEVVQRLLSSTVPLLLTGVTLVLLTVVELALVLPSENVLNLVRRADLSLVKLLCVAFIEIFRGVPLITLLFMSQTLVPLAFPEDFPQNSLFRAGIVITLFSAAYMAENIRGGLQAIHRGQAEAAASLGLPNWQITMFITLPQAIRNVIPAIVGQFISLFKDTSLVYIIGMLDVVEIGRAYIQGNPEFIPSAKELFIFLAFVFWIFTYNMSYVSRRIEQNLGVGRR